MNIVSGEQAIADRLIEFERKTFPDADRDEWIKRAIEHLIDDRR